MLEMLEILKEKLVQFQCQNLQTEYTLKNMNLTISLLFVFFIESPKVMFTIS